MAWIGVVDCNNFFVSCERLFRPDLQRKPVAVLSSNDGCIVARSQEVKDMGIAMGVPYFQVKDIIKDNQVTLFSSHFALYRDLSRRVFTTLQELLEEVEQYSIDEAFFTVRTEDDPQAMAQRVKSELEHKIGIPVSVGIAASKTQAKYAVKKAKKTNGVKVLTEKEWSRIATAISLAELWGVGGRLSARYQKAGYHTVADVLRAERSHLKALFGVGGERLQAELKGQPAYLVTPTSLSAQKSMMSSRSFKEATNELATLEDAIAYHTRHIATALRRQKLLANSVRISIRPSKYSDFLLQGSSLEAVFPAPTNDTFVLLTATQNLLREAYRPSVPYQKVGVSVGQLVSASTTQQSLFAEQSTDNDALLAVVDALNTKADKELITLGDRRRATTWQAKKELVSPAYTSKWTDVVMVKASSQ